MTQLERVPATRLRPGDVLYACDTLCELADTDPHTDRITLVTNCRRFTVRPTTAFRRVIRGHRINMRPDLGARRGTAGTATQTPAAIARRIRTGYAR